MKQKKEVHGKRYVQFGCGTSAPEDWLNFDSSPTLIAQRLPLIRNLLPKSKRIFSDNVRYGNIVRGLPVESNSVDGLFASHVLEHLSLEDFRTALRNSYEIMRPGGVFRLIVPNLRERAELYLQLAAEGHADASITFMHLLYMGQRESAISFKSRVARAFGNSKHLWMWDYDAMAAELEAAGFVNTRPAKFGDSEDPMFAAVEVQDRFYEVYRGTINECAVQTIRQ